MAKNLIWTTLKAFYCPIENTDLYDWSLCIGSILFHSKWLTVNQILWVELKIHFCGIHNYATSSVYLAQPIMNPILILPRVSFK